MEKCSTSPIIKEMQIQTTTRCHLTPIRVAVTKKGREKRWRGCGEGELLYWRWECKLARPLRKTVWKLPPKLKTELPYNPGISFLDMYPKEMKSPSRRHIGTPTFTAALPTTAKARTPPGRPPVCGWVQMWHIHTQTILFRPEKKEIPPFVTTWTTFEDFMLRGISQTEQDKCCVISLMFRILKSWTQFVLYFHVSGSILLACLFCWLGSPYRWDHMVFVFHRLAYIT